MPHIAPHVHSDTFIVVGLYPCHCYENASHLSSSGNFSFRWEAKASPTPKEVFSFIVVRLARANSEAEPKNLYRCQKGKILRSFLPQDDNIKVVLDDTLGA